MFKKIFLLAAFVLPLFVPGCAAASARVSSSGARAPISWQRYSNDEGGFSIQYPAQWRLSGLAPQNAGLLKGVRIEGAEGAIELYWGVGFGGMCEENGVNKYVKVQGAQGGLQTCYFKASNGVEQWNQISTPNLRPGFQARAWTNDGSTTSSELVRKVIATLTFDKP